jgi:hypothetical protein
MTMEKITYTTKKDRVISLLYAIFHVALLFSTLIAIAFFTLWITADPTL